MLSLWGGIVRHSAFLIATAMLVRPGAAHHHSAFSRPGAFMGGCPPDDPPPLNVYRGACCIQLPPVHSQMGELPLIAPHLSASRAFNLISLQGLPLPGCFLQGGELKRHSVLDHRFMNWRTGNQVYLAHPPPPPLPAAFRAVS